MNAVQPFHHLPPCRRRHTLDIQRLARRIAVASVLVLTRDRDATRLVGDEVCAAAGVEKGDEGGGWIGVFFEIRIGGLVVVRLGLGVVVD